MEKTIEMVVWANMDYFQLMDEDTKRLVRDRICNSLRSRPTSPGLRWAVMKPGFPTVHGCESYVNGVAVKQVKSANTLVDAMSATIMKQHNPGLADSQLRQLLSILTMTALAAM